MKLFMNWYSVSQYPSYNWVTVFTLGKHFYFKEKIPVNLKICTDFFRIKRGSCMCVWGAVCQRSERECSCRKNVLGITVKASAESSAHFLTSSTLWAPLRKEGQTLPGPSVPRCNTFHPEIDTHTRRERGWGEGREGDLGSSCVTTVWRTL